MILTWKGWLCRKEKGLNKINGLLLGITAAYFQ
jgi:hypothetical protein